MTWAAQKERYNRSVDMGVEKDRTGSSSIDGAVGITTTEWSGDDPHVDWQIEWIWVLKGTELEAGRVVLTVQLVYCPQNDQKGMIQELHVLCRQ